MVFIVVIVVAVEAFLFLSRRHSLDSFNHEAALDLQSAKNSLSHHAAPVSV